MAKTGQPVIIARALRFVSKLLTRIREFPLGQKPRDKYVVKALPKANRPGTWDSTIVEVYRRDSTLGVLEQICVYERHYAMLQTFEPFRQGSREYALISSHYTRTSVLDLTTGEVSDSRKVDSGGDRQAK